MGGLQSLIITSYPTNVTHYSSQHITIKYVNCLFSHLAYKYGMSGIHRRFTHNIWVEIFAEDISHELIINS